MKKPNNVEQTFGEIIRFNRVLKKIGTTSLARGCQCSQPYLTYIEHGQRVPANTKVIQKLAYYLGLDLADLMIQAMKERGEIRIPLTDEINNDYVFGVVKKILQRDPEYVNQPA